MNLGICQNCTNSLTDESALMTQPSSIFKGNNVYLMCKKCQQVLLYNTNRDMIFDLDDYKEDKEVIAEINKLLSEIDNHYEVAEQGCTGNCNSCQGCALEPAEPSYHRKPRAPQVEEPVEQKQISKSETKDMIMATLTNGMLAVNIKDPTVKLILVDKNDLDDLNIDEWAFFEMEPIEIQVRKVYDIVRR